MKTKCGFLKQYISILLCLALVLSYLPLCAVAAESKTIDVSTLTTDLVISPTGYTMNGESYTYEGAYTLTGTTNKRVDFVTGTYQVTAENLVIVKSDTYSGSAIELENGATLHLVLAGDNTLTGGWEGSGIRVNEGTSLTISGDGTLYAGYQSGTNGAFGAAIGGYCDSNFGTITINGGTIYATGTTGASIGSGSMWGIEVSTMTGTITINGGTVYADVIGNAALDGAVLKGSGGTIYCNTIDADTTELNAIVFDKSGTSATVYGNVTLADDFEVPSSGLTVQDGATLTIPAGKTLTVEQNRQISGNGTIVNNGTVKVGCTGATVPGGLTGTKETIHTYNADGVCSCSAVDPLHGCDFSVTGTGTYTWDNSEKRLIITSGDVTVSNKDKNTATSQRIYIQHTANVTLESVNIETDSGAPIEIEDYCSAVVTITLNGDNRLISNAEGKAAIHKERGTHQDQGGNAARLTITGSGSLYAKGGNNAAGIGNSGDLHHLTISGGTITAVGTGNASGIGNANGGSTWNFYITGGNITATGKPGIGANCSDGGGQLNAEISGGTVVTNSYVGNTPTGGLVSTDNGSTYTVYGDYTLTQDLTISEAERLTVAAGKTLTIADGVTLTNEGCIVNSGTITGDLVNSGTVLGDGELPAGVGGLVSNQYAMVSNGSGTGNYTEGSTVTITADAPASGKMFIGWETELGDVSFADRSATTTTFPMPEGCVIVKANYADIVATVTDSNGNVKPYASGFQALNVWGGFGGTLTVWTDDFNMSSFGYIPSDGVLDLNGHSMEASWFNINTSCTIQNGTILIPPEGRISRFAAVTFTNVTLKRQALGGGNSIINNDGTIVDAGLTLDHVTISGGTVKTGLTEDRVTLSGIPTEGYVYDGTAHEPGVKCGETALAVVTDYTVTFSHSNGGNSTVNAGTITMTITGTGSYTGTVTKTYSIGKAALTVTAENKEITYGDAVPNYTVTYSGFVNGEDETKLVGARSCACDYEQFSNKGTYTITPSGFASDNYEISCVSGTLTVSPKAITVTIANKTGAYGKAIAELTATDNGIVNNDTNVYSLATTATSAANVGTYPITGTALDDNYDITFVNGFYTITKAQAVGAAPTAVSGLVYNKGAQTLVAAGATNDGNMVYSLEKEGEYTSELPRATAAGTYYVWYKVIGDGNHNDSAPVSVEVEIAKADPGIGAVTANVVKDSLETGAIVLSRENTTIAGTLVVDAGQTLVLGDNEIRYTFIPADTDNYKTVSDKVTVTVVDTIAPVIGGVVNGATYCTTQTLTVTDKNLDTVTLNGEAVTGPITLAGNQKATYKIVATDKAGNTTTVTVKMVPITEVTGSADGKTGTNVTSADKESLQKIVDAATGLLKTENLTAAEKTTLEKVKTDAQALLAVIGTAQDAADTENINKVEDVTAENVKLQDKKALGDAKADLEKALKDSGGNYTAEEKKAIEAEIQRIEAALDAIENVEEVEANVGELPKAVEPDDEEAVEKIEQAKKTYEDLSDYEKSLVNEKTKEKLDKLTAAAVAYDIVKGDGSEWKKDTEGSVTFTANGPFSKFTGIQVDGKPVDAKHYEAKAGSTIITLKASYLDSLADGEHTITVVYTDGETEGSFEVLSKTATPETGDGFHVLLWAGMLFVSVAAMVILLIHRKRIAYKPKDCK